MTQPNYKFELPEGLIWNHDTFSFYFVDIKLNSIFEYKDGVIKLLKTFPENIGFVIPIKSQNVLICGMQSGLSKYHISENRLEIFQSIKSNKQRINDGLIDRNGIIWFGTMSLDESKINNSNKGCFYSYSPQNGLIEEDNDYFIPNGPIVSNDSKWLYHSDSMRGVIYRYKYNKQRLNLKYKEVFLDCNKYSHAKPSPDGMTFDENNNLVVAIWGIGEVWIISSEAKLLDRIKIPAKNVTNVCFGNNSNKKLLVTYARSESSYGGVYEVPKYIF